MFFGAGASFGSGSISPYETPLGSDLYSELKANFPRVWGHYDTIFKNGFEEGMQTLFQAVDVQELMRKMVEYFLGFYIKNESNLYVQLLRKIGNLVNDTVFSSLNYDLLFELALESCGFEADYFSTNSGIPFLKLHGSCNFLLNGVRSNNCGFMGANIIDWPLTAPKRDVVMDYLRSGDSMYPAMCLYTPSKEVQFGGGRILNIQRKWTEYVSNVDKILVIGVRPYEIDTHIWGPLAQSNAKIACIGPQGEFNQWANKHRNGKNNIALGKYWNDHFNDGIDFLTRSEE